MILSLVVTLSVLVSQAYSSFFKLDKAYGANFQNNFTNLYLPQHTSLGFKLDHFALKTQYYDASLNANVTIKFFDINRKVQTPPDYINLLLVPQSLLLDYTLLERNELTDEKKQNLASQLCSNFDIKNFNLTETLKVQYFSNYTQHYFLDSRGLCQEDSGNGIEDSEEGIFVDFDISLGIEDKDTQYISVIICKPFQFLTHSRLLVERNSLYIASVDEYLYV